MLSAGEPAFGRRPIPAALVCAGGVNAADHAQTFPSLADVLRKQVRSTDPHPVLDFRPGTAVGRVTRAPPSLGLRLAGLLRRAAACREAGVWCRCRPAAQRRAAPVLGPRHERRRQRGAGMVHLALRVSGQLCIETSLPCPNHAGGAAGKKYVSSHTWTISPSPEAESRVARH